MPQISSRDLVMLMISLSPSDHRASVGLGGITRLQKLLFLRCTLLLLGRILREPYNHYLDLKSIQIDFHDLRSHA